MNPIKDKLAPAQPLVKRHQGAAVEQAENKAPAQTAPSYGRVVSDGREMSAAQRARNQELVALYHGLREREGNKLAREASAAPANPKIKGWKKRTSKQSAGKSRTPEKNSREQRKEEDQD